MTSFPCFSILANVSVILGDNSPVTEIQLQGTVFDINHVLENILYVPPKNWNSEKSGTYLTSTILFLITCFLLLLFSLFFFFLHFCVLIHFYVLHLLSPLFLSLFSDFIIKRFFCIVRLRCDDQSIRRRSRERRSKVLLTEYHGVLYDQNTYVTFIIYIFHSTFHLFLLFLLIFLLFKFQIR